MVKAVKIEKMDLLISLYIFCIAVSELMGAKTFPIAVIGTFRLNASVAIFTIPIIFSINDVIIEVFGKERARSVLWSGLVVVCLLLLFSLLAISLPPSARFADAEAAYDNVFGRSVRFAAASLTAFLLSNLLDIAVFSRLRTRLRTQALWLRNNLSNFVSQFFDTTIFITLAFYSIGRPIADNIPFLASLIIPYWLLKTVISVIETPFVYVGVRWLKNESKG
jgi:queuosine precursor transporter